MLFPGMVLLGLGTCVAAALPPAFVHARTGPSVSPVNAADDQP